MPISRFSPFLMKIVRECHFVAACAWTHGCTISAAASGKHAGCEEVYARHQMN
jgi:hypothetical protein